MCNILFYNLSRAKSHRFNNTKYKSRKIILEK